VELISARDYLSAVSLSTDTTTGAPL